MNAFRVWSWNVLADAYLILDYYPHLTSRPESAGRLTMVSDVVARFADLADVICLQEVDARAADAVGDRLVGWDTTWVQRPGGRPDGSLVSTRSGLGARHTSLEILGRRSAATAEIGVDDSSVLFASVHISWAPPEAADHPGVEEVAELVRILGDPAAVVVAGDLNDDAGGQVMSAFERFGFIGCGNSSPTAFVNGGGRIIDHVVGRGVGLTDIPGNWKADGPLPDAGFPSDHVPVAALVTFD